MTADMDGPWPLPTGRVELPEEAQSEALRLADALEAFSFISCQMAAAELRRLATVEAERDRMREALVKTVELAEFWINREDTRDMPESVYASWLALGHHSNAMRLARAALTPDRSQS